MRWTSTAAVVLWGMGLSANLAGTNRACGDEPAEPRWSLVIDSSSGRIELYQPQPAGQK